MFNLIGWIIHALGFGASLPSKNKEIKQAQAARNQSYSYLDGVIYRLMMMGFIGLCLLGAYLTILLLLWVVG